MAAKTVKQLMADRERMKKKIHDAQGLVVTLKTQLKGIRLSLAEAKAAMVKTPRKKKVDVSTPTAPITV